MLGADRRIAGLWLGLLAFFIYGSWVPLELAVQAPGAAWQRFLALPAPWQGGQSRTDLAANFLLSVPLAFGAAYLVSSVASRNWRWGLNTLLWPALVLLSVGVEFGQVFFPPRTPSWTDVAMQVLGSTAGLALYAGFGARAHGLVATLSARLPVAQRLERWLFVYLLLLLVWQMMPLDLSLSLVELYRKWRDGRVLLLPFTALPAGTWEALYEIGTDVLLWLPVGALWWLSLKRPGLTGVLGRGVAVVAAVEFAQLFVLSRVTDLTDVFTGSFGVVAGAALARSLRRWRRWPEQRQRALLHGALALWAVGAVAVLWVPFNFELARGSAAAWWDAVSRLPFSTYMQRTEYGALAEILRKLLVFLPGGLLLALAARGPAPAAAPRLLAMGALAGLLEAGQVLLPAKVADLTDAALGLLGGWLGWQLGRALATAEPEALRPSAATQASAPRRARSVRGADPAQVELPGWRSTLLVVAVLALALWLLARLPGVPYNVAKLMPAGPAGALSALGVALALTWMLAAPLLLLPARRRGWRLGFPLLLLGHALLAFAALRLAVPLPMLHKVVGSPVLGLGGLSVLEDAGRYVALHAAVMLPLLGAVWLVRVVTAPRAVADLLWWAACSVLLFVPVHAVVVWGAGTDNLVELMRGGGSVASSLLLGAGWGALATAGVALAAALAAGSGPAGEPAPWRRTPLLLLAALALPAAPALLVAGLEPSVYKYGQFFSAPQFLLSAGRDAYAQGPELVLRAAVALSGGVLLVALMQWPGWRALAQAAAAEPRRAGPPQAAARGSRAAK
jgi:glycopeptide antibiotics resistance protein